MADKQRRLSRKTSHRADAKQRHFSRPIIIIAALAAGSCAHEQSQAVGVFHTEIIGKSVLLRDSGDASGTECILASATDAVLEKMRSYPSGKPIRLTYKREAYPPFPVLEEDHLGTDRYLFVRGQRVLPWCGGENFYWIIAIDDGRLGK
jgi:hypothetical protein